MPLPPTITKRFIRSISAEHRAWNLGKPKRFHRTTSPAKLRKALRRARALYLAQQR